MPRDGAGVFSLDPGYLAVSGEVIQPSQHNPPLEDLAAGVSDSIARTGVTALVADIPFGGFKATGLGAATSGGDAVNRDTADARYSAIGIGLTAAVGSNALVITLTNADGTALSSSAPVTLAMRSSTLATGTITPRTISSPVALTITSGSTLGTVSATPFSLYVAVFDDAGTARLAVLQTSLQVVIDSDGVSSATAEGGIGGADSAGVWYANAAISSKAYKIVGRLDFSAGQAASGVWATAPSKIDVGRPSLPGQVLATQQTTLTLSGTEQGWTSIPARTFKIDIGFVNVSTNGTALPLIQLGDSGGYEGAPYTGSTAYMQNAVAIISALFSTGFALTPAMAAALTFSGKATLLLHNAATNTWAFESSVGRTDATVNLIGAGYKSLSATLDRFRIVTANGSDTFDGGEISAVCWHF